MMVNIHKSWSAPALSAATALILLAGCNAPPPAPEPPPQPEAPAEPPPPPLLGGPPTADDRGLMGGPAHATPERPGALTTFRRADGVLVTVMRPIPNPEETGATRSVTPANRHAGRVHNAHHRPPRPRTAAPARTTAPAAPGVAHPLPPTRPIPPAKTVENPKPAPVVTPGPTSALVQPPAGPVAPLLTPTPASRPSWGDRFSGDSMNLPGLGPVSTRSFAGGMLVLLAMIIVVAIARRMANAREARERARAREARAGFIASSEPPATSPDAENPPP